MTLCVLIRAAALIAASCISAAFASSPTIRISQEIFVDNPPLPFTPPRAPTAAQIPTGAIPAALTTLVPMGQSWEVQLKDINLANTFQRWASTAGWRVRWDAQKHFMVEAPDRLSGTFEEVVESVLASPGIASSAYPLEVCFYPNNPPLARVTRKGEQDKECN